MPTGKRPQPVLYFQFLGAVTAVVILILVVVAVLNVDAAILKIVLTFAGSLVTIGAAALFGIRARDKVTPISSPKDAQGRPLAAADQKVT